MFLTQNITSEMMGRHRELIREFLSMSYGMNSFEAKLAGVGVHKGVYKVKTQGNNFLIAAALSLDKEEKLLEEYVVLTYLQQDVPRLFPKPIAHHTSVSDLGDLLAMEYVDMPDIEEFRKSEPVHGKYNRALAYRIGRDLGEVVLKTGRYSSEPHNGNILILPDGDDVILKFCDAAQYLGGGLEDQVKMILNPAEKDRLECVRFPQLFRNGLKDALVEVGGFDSAAADKELAFMKKYSGVL